MDRLNNFNGLRRESFRSVLKWAKSEDKLGNGSK